MRTLALYGAMAALLILVGLLQSWSVAFAILNLCLISAVMALGVNIQWGFAGLFNVGVMGFAALGGVAGVLVSKSPVVEAWAAGGAGMAGAAVMLLGTICAVIAVRRLIGPPLSGPISFVVIVAGYALIRFFYDPAALAIESIDPAKTGYLGGLGLPILLAWLVGGAFAAGAAWVVGKISLGLRSDYLAIATLGISEIIIAILKNEDWLTRGVKNVTGLPRPVPYEIELQEAGWFLDSAARFGLDPVPASALFVKIAYALLFVAVLLVLLWLAERALHSPWGRMMRAIRDNRDAAEAMGKDVTTRHLQTFVLGSAVIGVAGAMLTTLDGQFTPGSYNPLRYTFLIWVMVIVGGSGNNFGAVLGGFLIWFVWVEAEVLASGGVVTAATFLGDGWLKAHLIEAAPHLRLFSMGLILLLVLRFAPKGLLPEATRR